MTADLDALPNSASQMATVAFYSSRKMRCLQSLHNPPFVKGFER